jgi:hypothetical protein
MPNVINLPQDQSGFGPILETLVSELQANKERKRQQSGLLLNMLMNYGGTVPEEQMTGMEQNLGLRRGPIMESIMGGIGLQKPQGSILRNIAQPTYQTSTTEVPGGATVGPTTETPMFNFPSKEERAITAKKGELAVEQPYKLEQIRTTGEEQRKGIEERMAASMEQVKTRIEAQDKINEARINEMAAKRESTETINNLKMKHDMEKTILIQNANMEKAWAQMQLKASGQKIQTFEILDPDQNSPSFGQPIVAALNDNGQLVKIGVSGKAAEKQMTEEQKKSAFEGDMVRMGYMKMDKNGITTWNQLDENQMNTVTDIASKYGYKADAIDYKGFWGSYKIPKIDLQAGTGKRKVEAAKPAPAAAATTKPSAKDFFKTK